MKLTLTSLLLLLIIWSCKDPVHPNTNDRTTFNRDPLQKEFDNNKSRDVWQQPSAVLDLLGNIEGKTVADIGAGTGFFAFRVLLRNAKVIAVDIDPEMLSIVEGFKMNLTHEMQEKLETRLALPNDPKLNKDEADIILIINTIGYIENRIDYLRNLQKILPENGRLMIVDFKSKLLPIDAPDQSDRVPLFQLEKDLKAAGFNMITSNDNTLDYQYIIIADK